VLLTGDDYSHSALVTRDKETIVEQTPPKIRHAPIEDYKRFAGRALTVSRLRDVELEPVHKSADVYYDEGQPYGNAELAWVGFLLLLKHPSALLDRRLYNAIYTFLKKAVASKKEADVKNDSKTKPMFCSQFVYQCYDDGGQTLKIRNRALGGKRRLAAFAPPTPPETNLVDLVMERVERDELRPQPVGLYANAARSSGPSEEDIVNELYEALKGADEEALKRSADDRLQAYDAVVGQDLAQAVVDFAIAYAEAIPDGSGTNIRAKMTEPASEQERIMEALNKIKNANYVTPGDLTRIANKNAVLVGSFEVPVET